LSQHKAYETKDPMVIVKGEGMVVTDITGREYLDATSGGVWSVNVGYGRESISKAVADQLTKMCYFAGTAGTEPGALFAEKMLGKMPGLSRVYYSNSGSEANEKGYKMVRQLSHIEGDGTRHKIIYRNRDYHGTTIGALSSTGQEQRKADFGPFAPGFVEMPHCCAYRSPLNDGTEEFGIRCANEFERVILEQGPESVGSVVLEPITAGGGVIVPPEGYFPRIQEICRKYGILLHMDEVVCGFGRTGKWFGYQHFGVEPDIVTMAKGTASGYAALSCTVTTEALFDRFKAHPDRPLSYFRDISTFGGCTGGPAAAIEALRIVEKEKLVTNAKNIGDYFMDALHDLKDKHKVIGDVRGKGLLNGIELVTDRETKEPVQEQFAIAVAGNCKEAGVMIGRTNRSFATFNNTLCFAPALIAGKSEIDQIVETLDKALTKTAKDHSL